MKQKQRTVLRQLSVSSTKPVATKPPSPFSASTTSPNHVPSVAPQIRRAGFGRCQTAPRLLPTWPRRRRTRAALGGTKSPPKASDVVVISELLTHGNKIWQPQERDRRFIIMRYMPQLIGLTDGNVVLPFSDERMERLFPKTHEPTEFAP